MQTRIPRPALYLGLAGLIPFYAASVLDLTLDPLMGGLGDAVFAVYAAVILSFLGGARWGLELARSPDAPSMLRLVFSVTPSLIGWAIALAHVVIGPAYMTSAFALAFAAQYVWDRAAASELLAPAWYGRLRFILTVGVLGACLVKAFTQVF
jgi:hypothetical protein